MSNTDSLLEKIANAENARDAAEQRANEASEKIERLEAALEELDNNVPSIKAIIEDLYLTNGTIDKNWQGKCYTNYIEKSEYELINTGLGIYYGDITGEIMEVIRNEIDFQKDEKYEAELDYKVYSDRAQEYTKDLRRKEKKHKKN